MKKNQRLSGFTLIELLVVISIIGLLASVVMVGLNSARQKSRDAKRLADVRQIASALELYFNDHSSYPTGTGGVYDGTDNDNPAIEKLAPQYIGLIPAAPTPADGNCPTLGTNAYNYNPYSSGNNPTAGYVLTFCLGENTGGYSAGTRTLTQAGIQ